MRRFNPSRLVELEFCLGQLHQLTKNADADNGPSPGSIQAMVHLIEQAMEDCIELGLAMSLKSLRETQMLAPKALNDALIKQSGEGWPYLNRAIFDAGKRLQDELAERMFLSIPSNKTTRSNPSGRR